MSVARFIADQRTLYRVPVAFTCLILGVSISWFYKWLDRSPTRRQRRRAKVDAAVAAAFNAARGLHGSPRGHLDLRATGRPARALRAINLTNSGQPRPRTLCRLA